MSTLAPDPKHAKSDLAAQLAELPDAVDYDVERGLTRHRRLLTEGVALPEWASELPAARRGTSRLGKPGWWVLGGLLGALLMLAAWGAAGPSRRDVSPPAEPQSQSQSPSLERGSVAPPRSRVRASQAQVEMPSERQAARSGTGPKVEAQTKLEAPVPSERERELPVTTTARTERMPSAEANVSSVAATQIDAPHLTERVRASETGRARTPSTTQRTVVRTDSASPTKRTRQARVEEPRDAEEMRQLREAERLLSVDARTALALVRAGQLEFRSGYFTQERSYIEVMALVALGRRDEAQDRAALFMSQYPLGPYRHKVELALLRESAR